jgi:hypothetical protein
VWGRGEMPGQSYTRVVLLYATNSIYCSSLVCDLKCSSTGAHDEVSVRYSFTSNNVMTQILNFYTKVWLSFGISEMPVCKSGYCFVACKLENSAVNVQYFSKTGTTSKCTNCKIYDMS